MKKKKKKKTSIKIKQKFEQSIDLIKISLKKKIKFIVKRVLRRPPQTQKHTICNLYTISVTDVSQLTEAAMEIKILQLEAETKQWKL